MKQPTVKEIVNQHTAEFLGAKSSAELKVLFQTHGLATQHRWGKAVAAVIEIGGIDYFAARGEARAATVEALRAQVTHEVKLFVDAKARCQRFGITDADGHALWYGRFCDNDRSFSYGDRDEQSACECAGARNAIWLASKIKEATGTTAIRLHLTVDARWLCTLAGKATVLASDARRFNIDLHMHWVPGTENPADALTTASGSKKWSDNDLAALAAAASGEPPIDDVIARTMVPDPVHAPTNLIAPFLPPAPLLADAASELARLEDCLARNWRGGCNRPITTEHQRQLLVAWIERQRALVTELERLQPAVA